MGYENGSIQSEYFNDVVLVDWATPSSEISRQK